MREEQRCRSNLRAEAAALRRERRVMLLEEHRARMELRKAKRIQHFERHRMSCEERWQRQVQRQTMRWESRQCLRERRAMAKSDKQSVAFRTRQRTNDIIERRI